MSKDSHNDDIEFEVDADAADNTRSDVDSKLSKLKNKIKKLEEERNTYLDNWQRAQADFVNARKMDEDDKKRAIAFASKKLIEDIIPVLDSFEMALSTIEDEGVSRVYQQLKKVLTDAGVEQFDPTGEEFDPVRHEAMSTGEGEENKVLEVLQKGYLQNGEVIRTAKVVVGK